MEKNFYESLASVYHLIFENWDSSMHQQGVILSNLLPAPNEAGVILDCACGIGTQAIALATMGYVVEGRDLSPSAVERAQQEATRRKLSINFQIDDMCKLNTTPLHHYDVVICMDNSLPHLTNFEEITTALVAMRNRLKPGGTLLLSLRDYHKLIQDRPTVTPPKFFQDGQYRRIIHQVWDWQNERDYIVHLYITWETKEGWKTHHSAGKYMAIKVEEVAKLVSEVGFENVQILNLEDTGFYQPIIRANVE